MSTQNPEFEKLTPAQRQYAEIKQQYQDCIVFFRLGDFYETFNDDAKISAKVLDLVLTSRERNAENPTPMAGVPYHSADKYIARLVQHGYKVAIAEQMSEPKPGQIVERKVVQVVTPATFIEESKKEFIYMVAVTYVGGETLPYVLAWGDVTVGMYFTASYKTIEEIITHMIRLQAREVVLDIDFPEKEQLRSQLATHIPLISVYDRPADSTIFLQTILKVQTLSSFGKALENGRQHAMALLCNYINHIQPHALQTIMRVQFDTKNHDVVLDSVTIKNLEILSSHYDGSKQYGLLGVLDRTSSALGARLFREMLLHPTQDLQEIQKRHQFIQHYISVINTTKQMQKVLRHMVDIPKITSTILYKKSAPTVFGKLRYALELLFIPQHIDGADIDTLDKELARLGISQEHITQVKSFYEHLVKLLKVDGLNDDINYINEGYNWEIDELREIAYHSDNLLLTYQQELVQTTGMQNIKVKYISNQGYVLEVTPKDVEQFEAKSIKGDPKREMIRRQTLKTGQRYTTVYLDELQHKVLTAQFQLRTKEQELIEEAKSKLLDIVASLQYVVDGIAWLDVYTSHALFVLEKKYVQPSFVENGEIKIVDGRHPVIEEYLPHDQDFIPNDLAMGTGEFGRLHIITGPNMGGKSTFLRQNALLLLMAHCGLYVPATQATLPLIDGLFARVGSGDVIAKNQSTFMTEMIEMANIIHNATTKSFIILDELGRGTSTYDGMALAQAIVQYISQHIGAKTLFATHYHELIALENTLPGVKNYNVSVYETANDVVFMKKIIAGGASKSYGIDVAKLAGIPEVILDAAKQYVAYHESARKEEVSLEQQSSQPNQPIGPTIPLFAMHIDKESLSAKAQIDKIKRLINAIDINTITPLQALHLLAKLKEEI